MPEGLRNTGLTFYKMTKVALKDQVSRNVLSYIDDILVMIKKKDAYNSDLAETFTNMREADLKLKLEICILGITRGKVLGCLVSTKGIKVNPDKIRAITQMHPSQHRKDVQNFTGRIVTLNLFIAKLLECNLPFFTILRGSARMDWEAEQQKAFEDLKSYLQNLPTLSSPEQG
jgi:hypothetical protein